MTVSAPNPESEYEAVCASIRSLPIADDVAGLKEELRLTEEFMRLHETQTPCWKARQKARLVNFYRVAKSILKGA